MEGEELGKLLLDGLLVTEDGRLVAHDGVLIDPECIHVLAHGDLVLLCLILVRIKSSSEVLHLVLQCSGRTNRVLLLRWLWWWGLGRGLLGLSLGTYWDPKSRLVLFELIFIGGLIARVLYLIWPWYNRFVFFNHDRLDQVYPSLIIL